MKKTVKRKVAKRQCLPISAARVKALALAHETLVAASAAVDLDPALEILLEKHPALAAAWERGQFLRRLGGYAGAAISVPEVAKKMQMAPQALLDHIRTDREAKQVWDEARFAFVIEMKQAIAAAIKGGEISTTAVSRLENLFRSELEDQVQGGASIERCPIDVTATILGVTRQTLHKYHREKGLARNTDGTYNLKVVVPWYVTWIENKAISGTRSGSVLTPHTRMQAAKAELLETQAAQQKASLLDRTEVMAGMLARCQRLAEARRGLDDLAIQVIGQDAERIVQIVGEWLDRIIAAQAEDFGPLKLPSAAATAFADLLNGLGVPSRDIETEK